MAPKPDDTDLTQEDHDATFRRLTELADVINAGNACGADEDEYYGKVLPRWNRYEQNNTFSFGSRLGRDTTQPDEAIEEPSSPSP